MTPTAPSTAPQHTDIVGLLLAAGAGRRFGSDKLMHRLPGGLPMAVASALTLRAACDRLVVVTRSEDGPLAQALGAIGIETVFCPDAEHGMGHSLACGVRATAGAAGWVVALADMPFVALSSHQAVADALRRGASLAATRYQGQRGHPVGFSRRWQEPLAALSGDEGARTVLGRHADELVWCPVEDAGVITDIDRPQDLAQVPQA